jgi:DNA-binding NarL/FixJ family response regulator
MPVQLLIHKAESFQVKRLESILNQVGGFTLLFSNGNPAALQAALIRTTPELVLLELGPEVTFKFLSEIRQITQAKVVLWVDSISPGLALQAMTLGVRGILRKNLAARLQAECLRRVSRGEVWFEKALLVGLDGQSRPVLTRRENQVLRLLAQGLKNQEIATHLAVSEGTVKVYLTRLLQKAGAKDRFELALFGLKNYARGQGSIAKMNYEACALT